MFTNNHFKFIFFADNFWKCNDNASPCAFEHLCQDIRDGSSVSHAPGGGSIAAALNLSKSFQELFLLQCSPCHSLILFSSIFRSSFSLSLLSFIAFLFFLLDCFCAFEKKIVHSLFNRFLGGGTDADCFTCLFRFCLVTLMCDVIFVCWC